MEIVILKSIGCLAVCIVFYKLALENTSIHTFKRFYLLFGLVASILIPLITFTKYVAISSQNTAPVVIPLNQATQIATIPYTNYSSIIISIIYGLGILFFLFRFCFNLGKIILKIKNNSKHKSNAFTTVLIEEKTVPHTFLNYIFLNKIQFKNNTIPEEVILHEESHAKQKHSLDLLFIEFVQIIFWFNPLLHFIKKDIKLNHEFLADAAVLKQGKDASTYQTILLAFSSASNELKLANAINYSSIKKRFTIMKTQTSKKGIRIRHLIIMPLLGFLIFSFSNKESLHVSQEKNIRANSTVTINGVACDNCTLNLSKKETEKIILSTTTEDQIISFKVKFPGKPTQSVKGNRLNSISLDYLKSAELGTLVQFFNIYTKTGEKTTYAFIKLADKNYPHSTVVNKEVKSPPVPPRARKSKISNMPPPPPIQSNLDHIISMSKKGTNFYYNGNKITSDEAINLVKKNSKLNISSQTNNGKSTVYLSEKGMTIINGKMIKN